MGCDYYANEHGVFEIEISFYNKFNTKIEQTITFDNLPSNGEVYFEVIKGKER